MYCTNCGAQLQQDDTFCSQCGTGVGKTLVRPHSSQRLYRSIYNKKMAGICGGLAEYLAVDPTFVRLIFVVFGVCFPPFILGYLAAWIIVPKEPPRLPSSVVEPTPLTT